MCGILFYSEEHPSFIKNLKSLVPRGPDQSQYYDIDDVHLGFTRLAVVDPSSPCQPSYRGPWNIVFNGEIYNGEVPAGKNDVSLVLDMVVKYGPMQAPRHLEGMFAYVLYNSDTKKWYAARDAVGICPLYYGQSGSLKCFSSELKALGHCDTVDVVKPGHVYTHDDMFRFSDPYPLNPIGGYDQLRTALKSAVMRMLPHDVPWGVLLSGGLDSSIICGILTELDLPKGYPMIHSFSIGLKGSPDLEMARKQSEFCGTIHHEIIMDMDTALSYLKPTIEAIETFDVTTVRASVPMLYLAKEIKRHGVKVVISGEGSDELFSGYLYNRFAPTKEELHLECIRKMEDLHYYDCCRANKAMAAAGVECRVPYLNNRVVEYCMNIDPQHKMSGELIEKHILREAFKDVLHPEIYSRQKAQFSDAVGSEWIQRLKSESENHSLSDVYKDQPPQTKEAEWYRWHFDDAFGSNRSHCCKYHDDTIACSSAVAHKWSDFENDPSARSIEYK